jgi:small subunit ribosomal protein S8
MGMTDPIADLLTRVRNGSRARHQRVSTPWSRIKEELCHVLVAEGYLSKVTVSGEGPAKTLEVALRYTDDGTPAIEGIRRISRPGLRRYTSAAEAPAVRGGLGVSVLSTPAGLMPDREARRRKVGGEIICEVW